MNFAFNSDLYWPRYVHVSCNLKSKQTSQKKLVLFLKKTDYRKCVKPGLLEDPVIEAIARLEYEAGLKTGVLPGGCWYPYGGCTYPSINSVPPGGCGLVMGAMWLVVKLTPVRPNFNSAEFCVSAVLNYSSYMVLG